MPQEIETAVRQAVSNFENGYNCAQAVFLTYAQSYGLELETAAKLSGSFGGGMGRLREMCGAVTGMFLVLGMHYPATDPNDKTAKTVNYDAVQRTAHKFRLQMGSYRCADLLKMEQQSENTPSTPQSVSIRSSSICSRCVALATEIVGQEISGQK